MISFEKIVLTFDPAKDYTLQEIVEIVGISYSGVLGALKRGCFPSRKLFSRYYVNGKDIRNYLTKGK
jgi:hypothetical protein